MEYLFILVYVIITVLLMGTAFFVGLKLGMIIDRKEKIEDVIPKIPNPIEKVKKRKEKKKTDNKMFRLEQAWENLNNFDGTKESQKEIVEGDK